MSTESTVSVHGECPWLGRSTRVPRCRSERALAIVVQFLPCPNRPCTKTTRGPSVPTVREASRSSWLDSVTVRFHQTPTGAARTSVQEVDRAAQSRCPGQPPVGRDQARVEELGEGDVLGVVRGDREAQLPRTGQQRPVREALGG